MVAGIRGLGYKKIIIVLIAIVVILLVISGMILIYRSNVPKENTLTFCLRRTDGVSYWYYELSNDSILKLTEDKCYINMIGGDYDYWEFEPIGSGEVTIYFIDKEMALVTEENCFSITYYIDETGTITEVSSENKPDTVNFNNNIIGFIWIKAVDLITRYLIKILSFVIDGKYMRLFRAN